MHIPALIALLTLTVPLAAMQHEHDQLGRVSFPTSCDPKVQPEFERGVAMLHSYWFSYAGKTFRGVLEKDPKCAIAYWGMALDLLGNTLSAPPSRAAAQAAWELLEQARAIEVKTQRERDWIDAIRTYFRDHDKVAVDARLLAYNKAMRELAERYPDDFEAQVYYALTLQASAPKTDLTYANQYKSAEILETALRTQSTTSRHHALPDSRLRLRAVCGEGHSGRAPLCRYRACRAARAPHARAHLFHGGTVGGFDRVQSVGS